MMATNTSDSYAAWFQKQYGTTPSGPPTMASPPSDIAAAADPGNVPTHPQTAQSEQPYTDFPSTKQQIQQEIQTGYPAGQAPMPREPHYYVPPYTPAPKIEQIQTEGGATPSTPSKPKPKPQPQFDMQAWLNAQLAPYNKQMENAVQVAANQNYVQPWMPQSIVPAIQNLQKLTNSSLKGLMPATLTTERTYVQGQQAQELEQLLPSALIYHVLNTNQFTGTPGPAKQGVADLWKIFQQINMGSPDPTTASNTEISNLLQQLQPTGAQQNIQGG